MERAVFIGGEGTDVCHCQSRDVLNGPSFPLAPAAGPGTAGWVRKGKKKGICFGI